MKKQLTFVIAFFFLLMFVAQNVNAKPPFQNEILEKGLTLEVSYSDVYKSNQDRYIHTHVYDINGTLVPTSNLSCFYHAYSHNLGGQHIISNGTMSSYGAGFNATIPGSYFSTPGLYSVMQWCNSSTEGGFFQYSFEVTPTGTLPSTAQGLIYGLLIISSMFFLLICLYGAFSIDGKNEFTMGGDLIKVNFNKYYKGFLFLLAYLFAIFTSYLVWQVSSQFLSLDLGTAIFQSLFKILLIGLPIITIVLVIVGFVKWIADVELHKLAERGLKPR